MFVGSILQNYGKRCSLRFGEACTEFIIIYLKAKIKPRHACIQQRFQRGQGHFVLQVPCTVLHTTPPHSSTRSQCRIKWRSNIDRRTMLRRGGDFFVNQQAIPPVTLPPAININRQRVLLWTHIILQRNSSIQYPQEEKKIIWRQHCVYIKADNDHPTPYPIHTKKKSWSGSWQPVETTRVWRRSKQSQLVCQTISTPSVLQAVVAYSLVTLTVSRPARRVSGHYDLKWHSSG